jgi:hypothetical protein
VKDVSRLKTDSVVEANEARSLKKEDITNELKVCAIK